VRRGGSRRGARPIGIIGSGESATASASLLCGAADGAGRYTVVIDTRRPSRAAHESLGIPVAGPLARVSREELREAADEFVLAFAPEDAHHAVAATWRLIGDDLDFRVMPESLGCVYHLLSGLGWAEVPVVKAGRGVWHALALAWKRTMDVVLAGAIFTLLLPFMALVALLICLESPGPVIFTQDRVGKNGRVFRILKFRTMVAGAQAEEATMTADCAADPRFIKIDCDPRVTRLGRILRKTSIDELPQLWNVLRGQMSLVGPRPSQPSEVEHYELDHFTRLLVKPGVTGMWQVSGRSDLCFEEAVKLDSAYVRDWSPMLDLRILLKTVAVVLQCRGAC
jgi:exopolysaccharide biosynthesis polyprenyl glycosylphosphotransferase